MFARRVFALAEGWAKAHPFRMSKSAHPLWVRWLVMRRRDALCDTWRSFDAFAAAVMPIPAGSTKLARPLPDEPYGPGNWRWTGPHTGERARTYQRDYHQHHKARLTREARHRRYGLTPSEQGAMEREQGGGCAICGGRDQAAALALDHDHATGKVRGLLCRGCNVALGAMGDDASRLMSAAMYLMRFKPPARVA